VGSHVPSGMQCIIERPLVVGNFVVVYSHVPNVGPCVPGPTYAEANGSGPTVCCISLLLLSFFFK
jgi:hypothetical protein